MRWIRKQLELLKDWENKANRETTSGVPRYVVPVNLTQRYMGVDEDKILRFTEEDLEDQP